MCIITNDLWKSAYLLSEGAWLAKVEMKGEEKDKRKATFILTGHDMEYLMRRYKDGHAACNVRKLKASISYLKQIIFMRETITEEQINNQHQKTPMGENHNENRPECFREHQTLELA